MRTTTSVCVAAVLLTIIACAQERVAVTPSLDVATEEAVLESLAEQVYDALTTQDAEVIDRLVSPQVTGFFGNADFRGTGGLDAWYGEENLGVKIAINQRRWMIAPGLAVSTSNETWLPPGAPDREFLVTTVWVKKDGQWTVVHIHMSEVGP